MKEKEKERIMDIGYQINKGRSSVEVTKTERLNVKIRKKGYSILEEDLHSEH